MALPMRNNINVKTTLNQENANGIGKTKTLSMTGLPKRSALSEVGNVQARQTANLGKDAAAKKKEIVKPTAVKKITSNIIKPTAVKKKDVPNTSSLVQTKTHPSQSASQPLTGFSGFNRLNKAEGLLKPNKPVFRPLPSATTTSAVYSSFPKPTARPPLRSFASISLPKPSLFAPSRIVVPKFPENADFADIDKGTETNPIFLGEYAAEINAYMKEIEVKFLVEADFLKGQLITSKMRGLVVDWLVEVQQQYNLLHETLHLAVGIFDRFLQKHRTIERAKLQLVGVTAMWIASKFEEMFAPELENFVYITDRAYTKKEILKMEGLMHKTLDFCYGQPHSIHFLRRYTNACQADAKHHSFAKFFLELALVSYTLRSIRPSLLAAVALYIAHCVAGDYSRPGRRVWPACLDFYSTYTYDDIEPHIVTFAQTIIEADKSKLKAVQTKYSTTKYLQVSVLLKSKSEIIYTLAGISEEK